MLVHTLKSSKTKVTNVESIQQQPNAIDLTVDKVFTIQDTSFRLMSDDSKTHRLNYEVFPENGNTFRLPSGYYQVLFQQQIKVAENEAATIVTRSTLNRNGIIITSGLYDSGYSGVIGALLHNPVAEAYIERGARLAQLLIQVAETYRTYNGSYGDGKEYDEAYYTKRTWSYSR